jgi:hypothetical protein
MMISWERKFRDETSRVFTLRARTGDEGRAEMVVVVAKDMDATSVSMSVVRS